MNKFSDLFELFIGFEQEQGVEVSYTILVSEGTLRLKGILTVPNMSDDSRNDTRGIYILLGLIHQFGKLGYRYTSFQMRVSIPLFDSCRGAD